MAIKILIENIIKQYRDVQNGNLWIGQTFDRKLDQISEEIVFTSPIPGMHSIAEIISHLKFLRKETILKFQTGKGIKTDDCEENWLPNAKLKKLGWPYIKAEYDRSLTDLIDLLQSKDDDFLDKEYFDADFKGHFKYSFIINGMLHHDLYHLGQLGIIIRFLKGE